MRVHVHTRTGGCKSSHTGRTLSPGPRYDTGASANWAWSWRNYVNHVPEVLCSWEGSEPALETRCESIKTMCVSACTEVRRCLSWTDEVQVKGSVGSCPGACPAAGHITTTWIVWLPEDEEEPWTSTVKKNCEEGQWRRRLRRFTPQEPIRTL